MGKTFISSQQLLEASFRLASQVYEQGFRPDFIVGIWRGGAPIGIAVQEFFEYKGVKADHIAVRTSAYTGINEMSKEIRVHGLHYLIENANASDKLLIVDDVFDSGRSVEALLNQCRKLARLNMPGEVKIATPWYKSANNKTDLVPDFYLQDCDDWLVFPHELTGLTQEEILEGKGLSGLKDIL